MDGEWLPSPAFICIDDCTRKLTKDYGLFGYVTSGTEYAFANQVGDVMRKVEIEEVGCLDPAA